MNQKDSQTSSDANQQEEAAADREDQVAASETGMAMTELQPPESWADSGLLEGLENSTAPKEDRLVTKADELFGDLTTVVDD